MTTCDFHVKVHFLGFLFCFFVLLTSANPNPSPGHIYVCVCLCAYVTSTVFEGAFGGQAEGWWYLLQSQWSLPDQPGPPCFTHKGKCFPQSRLCQRTSPQLESCLGLASTCTCIAHGVATPDPAARAISYSNPRQEMCVAASSQG